MTRRLALPGLLLSFTALGALAQDPTPRPDAAPQLGGDVQLYSEASLRLHRQEHAAALELFRSLLAGYPESQLAPESLYWSGVCQDKLKRSEDARRSYEQLLRRYPDNPWCVDARQRLTLAPTKAAPLAQWRARTRDGRELAGSLGAVGKERLSVGEATLAWTELAELSRDGTAGEVPPEVIYLQGGDRLTARLVRADGQALRLDSAACGEVTLPRQALIRLVQGGRTGQAFAWSGTDAAPFKVHLDHDHAMQFEHGLTMAGGEDGEDRVIILDGEAGPDAKAPRAGAVLLQEGDDPVVILRQAEDDGREVRVVVKKGEEGGQRCVVVVRPDGEGEERRFELQLDDLELDGEGGLDGLAERIEKEVGKRLGDLDLDLDLKLEGVHEALKDVPDGVREKVKDVLKQKDVVKAKKAMRDAELEVKKALKAKTKATVPDGDWTQHFYKLAQPDGMNDYFLFEGAGAAERRKDADRVVLDNGDVLSGDLVSVDGERVHMRTSWGELKIDRKQVARILFRGEDKRAGLFSHSVPGVRVPTPAPTPRTPMLQPFTAPAPRAFAEPVQSRPFLGITPGEHDGQGVPIEQVHEGSGAAEAGLQAGDVLRELDGKRIESREQLLELIAARKAGDEITLTFSRGDDMLKRKAKLGARRATVVQPAVPVPPLAPTPPAEPEQPRQPRAPRAAPVPPAPPPPPPAPAPRRQRRTSDEDAEPETTKPQRF